MRYHISGNIRTEFGQGALLIMIRAYAAAERQDCPCGLQWQCSLQQSAGISLKEDSEVVSLLDVSRWLFDRGEARRVGQDKLFP